MVKKQTQNSKAMNKNFTNVDEAMVCSLYTKMELSDMNVNMNNEIT